jgi:hypothetical protein
MGYQQGRSGDEADGGGSVTASQFGHRAGDSLTGWERPLAGEPDRAPGSAGPLASELLPATAPRS